MRQIHVGDAALILARPRSLLESSGNAKLRTAIDRVRASALEEAP